MCVWSYVTVSPCITRNAGDRQRTPPYAEINCILTGWEDVISRLCLAGICRWRLTAEHGGSVADPVVGLIVQHGNAEC